MLRMRGIGAARGGRDEVSASRAAVEPHHARPSRVREESREHRRTVSDALERRELVRVVLHGVRARRPGRTVEHGAVLVGRVPARQLGLVPRRQVGVRRPDERQREVARLARREGVRADAERRRRRVEPGEGALRLAGDRVLDKRRRALARDGWAAGRQGRRGVRLEERRREELAHLGVGDAGHVAQAVHAGVGEGADEGAQLLDGLGAGSVVWRPGRRREGEDELAEEGAGGPGDGSPGAAALVPSAEIGTGLGQLVLNAAA